MINQGIAKYGLRMLDTLTDWFPTAVPHLFQKAFLAAAGSSASYRYIQHNYAQKLKGVQRFDKILVLVDVNIGDAVIMQSTVHALQECFPTAMIDYVCNAAGGTLVNGMPHVHAVYNIYTQFGKPSPDDMDVLQELIRRESYDVIFNFCGFINTKDLRATGVVVNAYVPWASEITRRWRGGRGKLHLTFAADSILRSLARDQTPVRALNETQSPIIRGSSVYLTHDSIFEAGTFLASAGLRGASQLVMLHADAPFQWTQIPIPVQSQILEDILRAQVASNVLLSCGNARSDIGRAVLRGVAKPLQDRVILVPPMSIAAHAALIDSCDVFVSGDTGNMHIAAARKIPLDHGDVMRNATTVVGVFGATDSRMSGYDSQLPEYLSGEQDAPAKVFTGTPPCRNISCINKPGKSCGEVRCFEGLDGRAIAMYINTDLRSRQGRARVNAATEEHH